MQQNLPNFCKCFGPGKINAQQDVLTHITATPPTANSCRCTPNVCPPEDKFLLICCNECVVNGPKECSKSAQTQACQVACAQPQSTSCSCCSCRRCPICLIRSLCRETWDAYQKEKTVRERYSIFDGGPSLTSEFYQAKSKYPAELENRTALSSIDKGSKKLERDQTGDEKIARKKNIKKEKFKDAFSDDDVSIKKTKKGKHKKDVSDDEIEDKGLKASKSKKGSKGQSIPDSSTDKKRSNKVSKVGKKTSDSDEDLKQSGKGKVAKKGALKKAKANDDEDDEPRIKKGKLQKKGTKGKTKLAEESSDEEELLKAKAKKGKLEKKAIKGKGKVIEDLSDDGKLSKTRGKKVKSIAGDIKSKEKGKIKDVKSKDTFRDGDKVRTRGKGKGGKDDRKAGAIDSEDSDIPSDKRVQKYGKGTAKSVLRQKGADAEVKKARAMLGRGERTIGDRLEKQKFSRQYKDARVAADWGLKDDESSDENLADRLYKEKMARLNAMGRKLTTSDYMRLRLEQRDLKGLDCNRINDICCSPCKPCRPTRPCATDPCICSTSNCCCPFSYCE